MQSTIPDILRKIRLDRKLSQENIADELRVNATTYGSYENGKSPIKFEQVAQLADFYKLTLDQLYHYGDTDYKVSEPEASFIKKPKVSVIIELDGKDNTLEHSIERLRKLNAVI